MGKVNVYFPDELEEKMRERSAPISVICQDAAKSWLRTQSDCRHRTLTKDAENTYRCIACGEKVL